MLILEGFVAVGMCILQGCALWIYDNIISSLTAICSIIRPLTSDLGAYWNSMSSLLTVFSIRQLSTWLEDFWFRRQTLWALWWLTSDAANKAMRQSLISQSKHTKNFLGVTTPINAMSAGVSRKTHVRTRLSRLCCGVLSRGVLKYWARIMSFNSIQSAGWKGL